MSESIWINGWEYDESTNKPLIRKFRKSDKQYGPFGSSTLSWWTWQRGPLWNQNDVTIRFKNITNNILRVNNISIRTCACDSGDSGFWTSTGFCTTPCKGYGGEYYSYVRVTNDELSYQESEVHTNIIPDIEGTNMNSAGNSVSNTASFGNPPYSGYKGFLHNNYVINNCPPINPDGIAIIHLGISKFNGPLANTVIKFNLDPNDMIVDMIEENRNYVWKFENNKWKLIKPAYIRNNNMWIPMEDNLKLW